MLRLDSTGDWFDAARRVHSPNFDARPPGFDVDLIVVHGISLPPGEFGGRTSRHFSAIASTRAPTNASVPLHT